MIAFLHKNKLLSIVVATVAGTIAFWGILPGMEHTWGVAAACLVFAAVSFCLLWRAWSAATIRLTLFALIGGALMALLLTVGAQVFEGMTVPLTLKNLLCIGLRTLGLMLPIAAALLCLLDWIPRLRETLLHGKLERSPLNPAHVPGGKTFLIVWGVLILCWLPTYLAYFPGVYGYDMHNQNHQALTGLYNAYQPLLHTLFYGLCYRLGLGVFGTGTAGVAVYTAAQSLILSACLAYSAEWLAKRLKVPFLCFLCTVAFYALLPVHAILAVSSTKDTLFAGCFLLLLLQTIDLCMDADAFLKDWKRVLLFVCAVLLTCLLRNNMLYAFLFAGLFLVLGLKQARARVLLLVVCAVAVAVVGGKALSAALNAGSGPRSEMLNVPIQQVACVYERHADELTNEERQAIYAYLPQEVLEDYSPLLSDPVKLNASIGDGMPSITGFLKVWAHLLPGHFNDYADSFFTMTLGYWYPCETFHAHIYDCYDEPDTEETLGYMYTGFLEDVNPDVQKHSLWPAAERYYQWFAHENGHQRIPIVALLFAPGTYCWIMLFTLIALLYFRRMQLALPLTLPFGVWLTLLLGPCVIVRYVYPILAAAPVMLGLLMNGTEAYGMRVPESDGAVRKGGRGAEMLRFVIAGGLGFVIDYGLMVALTELMHVHYLVATGVGFAVSVVVNYLLCAYWVFQGANTSNKGVKAAFIVTSLIGLALNELIMFLLVDAAGFNYMIAKIVAVVLVMIWNYITKRRVLVKKNKESEETV